MWWLHTLTLLVFLPLIPHTKHLHLALSPATVFLKREGFSNIPPLAGDEDFGLDTGKDVTRIDALQAFSCVECGRCTEHCPAYNTGKILNPKEIVLGLRDYLNEFGPDAKQPLLGKFISEEAAFQCTTCGSLRIPMPGGHPASADDRRPAPRRGQYGQVGRRIRHQAVSESGAQRQLAGLRVERAPEVHREERTAASTTARRNTACGSAAWARTIRRAARSCWRWRACCATPA